MLLEINAEFPEPRKVRQAVEVLEKGGVIGYPTDTVYGLGCDLMSKSAIERLYQIKGMQKNKSLAFICHDLGDIAKYAVVDNWAYRILKRHLPGRYCFILPATREVPKRLQNPKRRTIGIRVPDNAIVSTLLAELAGESGKGAHTYESELAWREFYADVLWHHPRTAWEDLRPEMSAMRYDEPQDAIEAWKAGRTGYPIVDAGMRQLLAEGWMHNRVRMIAGSFLTKDLHVWWPLGARHFMEHLIDGDIASNTHGWQWVAGTGTDASPYFRVFNPVTQGLRFDPDGDYVRRWVPELAHVPGAAAHEPWDVADGYDHGYPARIVDHAAERIEAPKS